MLGFLGLNGWQWVVVLFVLGISVAVAIGWWVYSHGSTSRRERRRG